MLKILSIKTLHANYREFKLALRCREHKRTCASVSQTSRPVHRAAKYSTHLVQMAHVEWRAEIHIRYRWRVDLLLTLFRPGHLVGFCTAHAVGDAGATNGLCEECDSTICPCLGNGGRQDALNIRIIFLKCNAHVVTPVMLTCTSLLYRKSIQVVHIRHTVVSETLYLHGKEYFNTKTTEYDKGTWHMHKLQLHLYCPFWGAWCTVLLYFILSILTH